MSLACGLPRTHDLHLPVQLTVTRTLTQIHTLVCVSVSRKITNILMYTQIDIYDHAPNPDQKYTLRKYADTNAWSAYCKHAYLAESKVSTQGDDRVTLKNLCYIIQLASYKHVNSLTDLIHAAL